MASGTVLRIGSVAAAPGDGSTDEANVEVTVRVDPPPDRGDLDRARRRCTSRPPPGTTCFSFRSWHSCLVRAGGYQVRLASGG